MGLPAILGVSHPTRGYKYLHEIRFKKTTNGFLGYS